MDISILKYNFKKVARAINFLSKIILFLFIKLYISDPGIPQREYYRETIGTLSIIVDLKENFQKCSVCNIIIPKFLGVCHCTTCGVCIEEHEIHFNLIGKCIGKNNVHTLTLLLIVSMVGLICILISFFTCFIYLQLNRDFSFMKLIRLILKFEHF